MLRQTGQNQIPRNKLFGFARRKTSAPTTARTVGGGLALVDPADPRASIRPVDLVDQGNVNAPMPIPPVNSTEYKRIVEEVQSLYKHSKESRNRRAQRWELCQRYYEGDQWTAIDEDHGVIDIRRTNEDIERSVSLNQITYIVQRLVSYLTQNDPQVQPLALVDTPLHKQAAMEADGLAGKMYRDHNIRKLRERQIIHALVTTTAYRYWMWNPAKEDLIPIVDESGMVVGAEKQMVGGLEVQVLRGTDVYWEASAPSMQDAYQCVIATIKPLSWIQATYGKPAYGVEPDATAMASNNELPYMNPDGRLIGQSYEKRDAAIVYQWLVRPQADGKYPDGLYVVVANGKILYRSAWPWADKTNWPMSELQWMERHNSPYGVSLVDFLEQPQTIINREFSRIAARLDKDKRMVFIQKLSGVGPNDFEELRDLYKVYYNAGSQPPTVANMPPINEQHFRMVEDATAYMEKISGMVDVLRGDTPMSQMSGVLYDLMLESATTTLAPFMHSIGQNEVDFLRGAISEYTDKGSPLVMIGLDPRGNKPKEVGSPAFDMKSLQALTDGGQVELYLNPTSGLLKSPAGQQKEIDEKYQMGLFGLPGSPEALKVYWSLSNNSLSQKVLDMMAQQEALAAQNPPPDPAQMQMQIDQNKEEARLEREAEMARLKHNLAVQKSAAQAHIDAASADAEEQQQLAMMPMLNQMEQQKADQAHRQELERMAAQTALDMQKGQVEHGQKTQMTAMQHAHQANIAEQQMKQQMLIAKIGNKNKPAPTKK